MAMRQFLARLMVGGAMATVATSLSWSTPASFTIAAAAISAPQENLTTEALAVDVAEAAYNSTDLAWTNLSNAAADDASYATVTNSGGNQGTKLLVFKMGANALNVPAGALITGMEVTLKLKSSSGTNAWVMRQAYPVYQGKITGLNLAPITVGASSTEGTLTFGGDGERFGIPWTADAVNAADFGFAVRLFRVSSTANTLSINCCTVKLYYTTNVFADASKFIEQCQFTLPHDATDAGMKPFRVACPGITPTALLSFAAFVNTGNLTTGTETLVQRNGMSFSAGAWTSAQGHYATVSSTADNVSPASSRFQFNDTLFGSGEVSPSARKITVSAVGAGYVDLTWTSTNNPQRLMILPIAAAGQYLNKRDWTSGDGTGGTTTTETVSHDPELLICIGGMEDVASGSHGGYNGLSIGFATANEDNTYTQCLAAITQDVQGYGTGKPNGALTDPENNVLVKTGAFYFNRDNGTSFSDYPAGEDRTFEWVASARTSASYAVTRNYDDGTSGDSPWTVGDGCAILSLTLPDGIAAQIGTFATATATGTQDAITPSSALTITPRFVLAFETLAQSIGSLIKDSGSGDMMAAYVQTRQGSASTGATMQNGTNPTNTMNWFDHRAHRRFLGDQTAAHTATAAAMLSTGPTESVTVANGTARHGVFMAIS